jgi:ABC-type transport system involved in multi-copper enzyme maturation permease subunit
MSGTWAYRIKTAVFLGLRGFRSILFEFSFYLVAFFSCLIAATFTYTYVGTLKENGLLIISNPLNTPFSLAIVVGAVYLAVIASMTISKERDSGTLEVLFYGPVDEISYILAKFIEQMLAFIIIMLFYVVIFFLFGLTTNFGFFSFFGLRLLLAFVFVLNVIAFGILLSSIFNKSRTSLLTLIAIFLIFLIIQWGESLLIGLDPASVPPLILFVKSIFSLSSRLIEWLSPFSYLNKGVQAILVLNISSYMLALCSSVCYTILLFIFTLIGLRKKGVKSK